MQKEDKSGGMKAKEAPNLGDLMLIEYPRDEQEGDKVTSMIEGENGWSLLEQNTSLRVPLMDCTNRLGLERRGKGEEDVGKKKRAKGQLKRKQECKGKGRITMN